MNYAIYYWLLVTFFIQYDLVIRGRRYLRETARSRLKADQRAPVLLLRSFHDDTASADAESNFGTHHEVRIEDELADCLQRVGPLIAIGNPKDVAPETGAAREYLGNDDWKASAAEWISKARLIVVVVGTTPGLGWEVEAIRKSQATTKTLWLVLMSKREERLAQLSAFYKGTEWDGVVGGPEFNDVRAFYFRPGCKATAYRSRGWSKLDYEVAITAAIYDGQPPSSAPL